ncbi:response regulator transcription factor [Plantactinospora sp. B6F1]|uniref:response regulator n=1 Tax=Plantactinospora sp. B6F1 TaxID=3158971 RepID=UPI00102AE8CB
MTRVVVVDDQTLVRQGIRGLLEVADIEVVGEAGDGQAALAVIAETSPDVILLDLRMPRYDGIWTLDRLHAEQIDIPVLVLTTFDDDELVIGALRAGARGYLLKDVTLERLTRAIRTLADGGTLIAPSITDRMLRAIRSGPSPAGPDPSAASAAGPGATTIVQSLTEREQDVLGLVARGYSNREIAEILFLAEGTVKNHVSAILTKLGARDRTNAVLRALHEGILE